MIQDEHQKLVSPEHLYASQMLWLSFQLFFRLFPIVFDIRPHLTWQLVTPSNSMCNHSEVTLRRGRETPWQKYQDVEEVESSLGQEKVS